jgi:hypothetical protein
MNYKIFHNNGQGEYVLDLLRKNLTFNGSVITPFSIFSNIQKWFDDDVNKYKIDKNFLMTAKVFVKLGQPIYKPYCFEQRKWFFFKKIYEIQTYEYRTNIIVELKTDEKDYSKASEAIIM